MPTEQAVSDLLPKRRKKFKVPVEALSNGIDLSRFTPGKAPAEIYERYNIPKTKPIVLYVGRVDPEKSLEVLVKAFNLALLKCPEAHLVVVGDGASRNELEKLSEKLGIEKHTHFLGRVVGNDLPMLYRTGKVFGITSKTETQSIVIMEAMASGLPVVAVQAGAIPELVKNNKTGYLCQQDDPVAVSRAIVRVLKNDLARQKFSKTALENIKKHDISYTLTRFEAIYKDVVERHKKN